MPPPLKFPKDGKKHIIMQDLWWFQIKTENGVIFKFKAWFCANSSHVKHSLVKDLNFDQKDNYARTATTESFNLTFAIAQ